ncbi:MAG: DUF2269 family protein [Deltaproteobacteria bacterium]|jgi:hypothetical protein|nr:DUF2269 family protein [Deltaproteobacteria bacterium]
MPTIGSKGLKILKFLHLIAAGLWLGGSLGLNLMIIGLPVAKNDGQLYGFNVACKFIDDMVVIPGAIGCLLTGFLISLLTQWGFTKHRWVIIKWCLTVFCILFGIFFLSPTVNNQPLISSQEGLLALANNDYVKNYYVSLRGGLFQLFLIFFMFWLSVFRPLKGRGRGLMPVPKVELKSKIGSEK